MLNSIFFFHGGRTIQYDPERNQFLVVIDIRLTDVALIQSLGVYIWKYKETLFPVVINKRTPAAVP